jgi:endoglucanase
MIMRLKAAAALLAGLLPIAAEAGTDSLPVGTCINIGNSFESPTEAAWGGRRLDEADLKRIARAGFVTIRLPVRWDTHADKTAPYRIDAAYMARIKSVVTQARAAGLNVILNSHHFERIHQDPLGAAPQLAAMWDQIAASFADMPREHLWFEIENEPHDKFNDSNLLDVLTPALAAIRKTNPDRPVIIGGQFWSGVDSLATLKLPDDPNIVPTFHYYEPFAFTHQGASWVKDAPPLGRRYGTADDAERLSRDVQKVKDYIARTGKTPFIGETGAHTTVTLDQRIAYHKVIHQAFAPMGIGRCIWAYANTFPFFDNKSGKWLPGLRGAIGLKEED